MINLMPVQTGEEAHPVLQKCQRHRMMLAFALFDVETAHTHLKEMEPGDHRYRQQLEQLNTALQAYWRIDEQVTNYLQRAKGN